MKILALATALVAAAFASVSSPAQADSSFYVLANGTAIAGPFESYYACSKVMDIYKQSTTDVLICAMR